MDVLGSVGCLCQPLGKLRVSLPLAQSPGAVCSIQPGEAIGPESELSLLHQTGPIYKCVCVRSECVQLDLTATETCTFMWPENTVSASPSDLLCQDPLCSGAIPMGASELCVFYLRSVFWGPKNWFLNQSIWLAPHPLCSSENLSSQQS